MACQISSGQLSEADKLVLLDHLSRPLTKVENDALLYTT